MPRKKTKQKNSKKSTGIVKISNLAPKSFLSNAFSNYKKNKELNKIKAIKLEKLKDKNQILKAIQPIMGFFKVKIHGRANSWTRRKKETQNYYFSF